MRRPIVVVEDHLYHITQLVEALSELAPSLLRQTAILCLERPGPDTDRPGGLPLLLEQTGLRRHLRPRS